MPGSRDGGGCGGIHLGDGWNFEHEPVSQTQPVTLRVETQSITLFLAFLKLRKSPFQVNTFLSHVALFSSADFSHHEKIISSIHHRTGPDEKHFNLPSPLFATAVNRLNF